MPDDVVGFIDSDFARSKPNQKLTWGYIFMLAEGAISHSSKLHSVIAFSKYEAKYIAICKARKEAVWLRYLLEKLEVREPGLI